MEFILTCTPIKKEKTVVTMRLTGWTPQIPIGSGSGSVFCFK